jgi:N utilization substance protein B
MNEEPTNAGDDAAKPARKPGSRGPGAQRRSNSRRLAMQALYQLQLNPQPWQDIHLQFTKDEEFGAADADYFRELLKESAEAQTELEAVLAGVSQIPPHQLDPVERAILLLSMYELRTKVDVPYRVVINEGIELAKRYGATDGHKFVNGVLDRAARTLRPHEQGARR